MAAAEAAELALLRQQYDQVHQQMTRQMASLTRVVELLDGDLAIEPLLTRLIEYAIELVGAAAGTIVVGRFEVDGPVIEALAGINWPPKEQQQSPQLGRLDGLVMQQRQPIRLDRYADLGEITVPELAEHAMLGMPMLWRDSLIGVLILAAPPPRRFSDDDLATAKLFARHAATTIEQARVLETEQRRLARSLTISHIGRLLSSRLSLEQLLETAMEDIGQHHPDLDIAIMLVDAHDPRQLVLRARRGPFYPSDRIGQYRQSIEVGIIGAAARERRPLLIQDIEQDERYVAGQGTHGIRAELAVPLVAGSELLGVFNAESSGRLAPDDAEALVIIGEQLAIAIHNATLFDSTQQGLAETTLLFETSQHIGMAMDVDSVVAAYLEKVAARGRYNCTVVLFTFDAAERRSGVHIWGQWSPEEGIVRLDQQRQPRPRDELDPLLDAGQTVVISDVQSDPRAPAELRRFQAESGRPALAIIPLMARGQRIGQIILSAARVQRWPAADLHPYQITAAQLAAVIDSRRQQQALTEQGQNLVALEERRRLARELHDSVTQSLVSVNLMAQVLPELWQIDQAEARLALAEIRDQTRRALAEMRALLIELRPADGEAPDLVTTISHQLAAFERRTGLGVTRKLSAAPDLPPAITHSLARICQEALNNIARHAHARHVSLELAAGPPLQLIIADDGRGFAPDQVGDGHLGLVSMRERAAALSATLQIESRPGAGCRIVVTMANPATPPMER